MDVALMDANMDWSELEIQRTAVTGTMLSSLITFTARECAVSHVFVANYEGGADNQARNSTAFQLMRMGGMVSVSDLQLALRHVEGIDWIDLYLCNDSVQTFDLAKYAERIALTPATVRVVDGSFLYVYVPDTHLADAIQSEFGGRIQTGDLRSFVYSN